jgi:hypothetical protein
MLLPSETSVRVNWRRQNQGADATPPQQKIVGDAFHHLKELKRPLNYSRSASSARRDIVSLNSLKDGSNSRLLFREDARSNVAETAHAPHWTGRTFRQEKVTTRLAHQPRSLSGAACFDGLRARAFVGERCAVSKRELARIAIDARERAGNRRWMLLSDSVA